MNKKSKTIVIFIVLVVLGIGIYNHNVYDTPFYSVCFLEGVIHTPNEIEEITYISFLVPEMDGVIVLEKEDDLAMWNDFIAWLNDTKFKKVRGTWGRSYPQYNKHNKYNYGF